MVSHSRGKIAVAVSSMTVVSDIKLMVEKKTGVAPAVQLLMFAGRALSDERTVDDYNLLEGTTIHMLARELQPEPEPEPEPEPAPDMQLGSQPEEADVNSALRVVLESVGMVHHLESLVQNRFDCDVCALAGPEDWEEISINREDAERISAACQPPQSDPEPERETAEGKDEHAQRVAARKAAKKARRAEEKAAREAMAAQQAEAAEAAQIAWLQREAAAAAAAAREQELARQEAAEAEAAVVDQMLDLEPEPAPEPQTM
eukprot:COSAG06_NODE_14442_length_1156_cov_1.240303_1_plen_259_part_10